jgi:hypothetical protein
MNARIDWEVPWAQVPARDKAKLFEVVSVRDYTTEQICIDLAYGGSSRLAISIRSWRDLRETGLLKKS